MKDFDVDEWYRRYHRYPLTSDVRATHEVRDAIEAYKKFVAQEVQSTRS